MAETSEIYMKPSRTIQFAWIPDIFFKPRQAFTNITRSSSSWLAPLLVLSLTILLNVIAMGWLNQRAITSGIVTTPPDFQYWPPQMQDQYMQSLQVRQGPVFLYVIPAIGALAAAWIGWLLVGGMLHLAMTLLGGRGETSMSITIVAWASLPLALRDLVRVIYLVTTRRLITSQGLSGFINLDGSGTSLFLSSLLSLVDVYLIWHILLMVLGLRVYTGLSRQKAITGAVGVILVILGAQVLFGYITARLGALSVIRPFLF